MFGNSTISIDVIQNNVNTENDAWGYHFYDKICPQKILSVQWTSLHAAINWHIYFVSLYMYITMRAVTSNFIELWKYNF